MTPEQETQATWNKLAMRYAEKFMDLSLYDASYDLFIEGVQKSTAKVLEIGCGPGNITRYLLSKRPDWELLGTDLAPNMVELAQKLNPTARFKLLDARHIMQLNEHFDGIVVGFCLPYLTPEETHSLLADAFASLEAEGCIYVSFVPGDPRNSGFVTGSTGDRTFFYYHETSQLVHWLSALGFVAIQQMEVAYPKNEAEVELHMVLVACKAAKPGISSK